MKAFIRRHIAPLCLLLSVTVLLAAFFGVRLSADAGTYALVHRSGDAAQLHDLRIRLVLSDDQHEQHITIDGGALTHRFSAVPSYANTADITYMPSQDFTEDPEADVRAEVSTFLDSRYERQETLRDVMTRHADRARLSMELTKSGPGKSQAVHILTDLYVQDDAHPFVSTFERFRYRYAPVEAGGESREDVGAYDERRFEMPDTRYQVDGGRAYDLIGTDAQGRVYFTPAVLPGMQGECAVYRVEEWSKYGYSTQPAYRDGYEYSIPYAATERGKVAKIASFPVQDTTMLRLDIAEDRVCLLSIEGGMLTFRAYTIDGALIAQTPLFALDPDTSYSTGLRTNRDGDSAMLCYALYTRDETGYSKLHSLACVELASSSAALRSRIKPDFDFIDNAFFNGRWALLRIEGAGQDGRQDSLYSPLRYTLELLDADGDSLYDGEIVSDAPEDQLQYYGRTVENTTGGALRFSPGRMLRFADDPISGR
jgi:hypothetical protein